MGWPQVSVDKRSRLKIKEGVNNLLQEGNDFLSIEDLLPEMDFLLEGIFKVLVKSRYLVKAGTKVIFKLLIYFNQFDYPDNLALKENRLPHLMIKLILTSSIEEYILRNFKRSSQQPLLFR
jgi:hypothetical protein